ncbi:hypothetical protein NM208_g16562 [Fusarium decemcellulare]|uniref:Uncharacterized protein n=1 Tax=Fusarium decemcellulare TaxID=57161 RepID=A0ACC1R9V3_9HYPO|nr:hypothetical protein NM208_g16562 [Fusarium decemcellulare]
MGYDRTPAMRKHPAEHRRNPSKARGAVGAKVCLLDPLRLMVGYLMLDAGGTVDRHAACSLKGEEGCIWVTGGHFWMDGCIMDRSESEKVTACAKDGRPLFAAAISSCQGLTDGSERPQALALGQLLAGWLIADGSKGLALVGHVASGESLVVVGSHQESSAQEVYQRMDVRRISQWSPKKRSPTSLQPYAYLG